MYEIHIARALLHDEVQAVVAETLGVATPAVVDTLDVDLPETAVWCTVVHRPGDFSTTITIMFRNASTDDLSEEVVAARIARYLDCQCLVSDNSPNPFSWKLLSPEGRAATVTVDPTALDRDELRLTAIGGDTP